MEKSLESVDNFPAADLQLGSNQGEFERSKVVQKVKFGSESQMGQRPFLPRDGKNAYKGFDKQQRSRATATSKHGTSQR